MIKPKKYLGQNFLVDESKLTEIVGLISPQQHQIFCEIGAGTGALTKYLADTTKSLLAIELDARLAKILGKQFAPKCKIITADALTFDYANVGDKFRLVGNLPYYISSELVLNTIKWKHKLVDVHFLLQNELVDRICAKPNCKNFGRLSVIINYHFETQKLITIQPDCFRPVPKVESALFRMKPRIPTIVAKNTEHLIMLTKQAFANKRKKIRNNLKNFADWQKLNLNPDLRAENFKVDDFVRLSNYCLDNKVIF